MVKELNGVDFRVEVLESDIPVLVDFWAPWCGPCRMLGPIIDTLSNELEGKAKVFKINVDDNAEAANRYQIISIPTVLIFDKGELKNTLLGVHPKHRYLGDLGIKIE